MPWHDPDHPWRDQGRTVSERAYCYGGGHSGVIIHGQGKPLRVGETWKHASWGWGGRVPAADLFGRACRFRQSEGREDRPYGGLWRGFKDRYGEAVSGQFPWRDDDRHQTFLYSGEKRHEDCRNPDHSTGDRERKDGRSGKESGSGVDHGGCAISIKDGGADHDRKWSEERDHQGYIFGSGHRKIETIWYWSGGTHLSGRFWRSHLPGHCHDEGKAGGYDPVYWRHECGSGW